MNALTADVDDAAEDYVHQPVNFGQDTPRLRTAEADAFRAGVRWTMQHVDWRVLAGSVPGHIFAGRLRLGDRVMVTDDVEGVIITLTIEFDQVRFTLRTDAGAEISYHRPRMEAVMVLDVGRSS